MSDIDGPKAGGAEAGSEISSLTDSGDRDCASFHTWKKALHPFVTKVIVPEAAGIGA